MYTKQEIILRSYREGKSQRSISRELKISRVTVKRYIEEYESMLSKDSSDESALTTYLSTSPSYKKSNRCKLKLTQDVTAFIDRLLEDNNLKRQQGLRKQLLKKYDIYEQLRLHGFDVGYTTVCNYVRSQSTKSQNKEAYIRQSYQPGDVCEFDWGEVKLFINDELVRFQMAVFTSAYSNYRFAALYQRQDTLAFMESHVAFFDYTQGVYKQMVYDNMRVAVAKFIGPTEKEPTQALLQLRGHYRFTHRFCNAYRGNEKGHVERSVEYIRRKAFGIKCHFETQEQAHQWLLASLSNINNTKQKTTNQTASELFAQEAKHLIPTSSRLACCEQIQLRVDKYATVCYRTNRYSVPDNLVGQFIDAKISSHQCLIYYNNELVATHHRTYKKHQWVVEIQHYLRTFKQKPGALSGSVALASNAYLQKLYNAYFINEPREFIELLAYCQKHKITDEKLESSISRLFKSGIHQITTQKLTALLGNKQSDFKPVTYNQITKMAQDQLSQITALMN